jgi:hypothetical protein
MKEHLISGQRNNTFSKAIIKLSLAVEKGLSTARLRK